MIAVDGPAAAGKGTLARRLAEHYGFAYLDTGLLYRAVARRVLDAGFTADMVEQATAVALDLRAEDVARGDLRTDAVAVAASQVAALPPVRDALLTFQRQFAHTPPGEAGGAVLDGRDIGTVVCPNADVKLFVTASLEVRALRRLKELRDQGLTVIHSRVLQDMRDRDARDMARSAAPLAPAEDAIVIDTSALDADEVFEVGVRIIGGVLNALNGS